MATEGDGKNGRSHGSESLRGPRSTSYHGRRRVVPDEICARIVVDNRSASQGCGRFRLDLFTEAVGSGTPVCSLWPLTLLAPPAAGTAASERKHNAPDDRPRHRHQSCRRHSCVTASASVHTPKIGLLIDRPCRSRSPGTAHANVKNPAFTSDQTTIARITGRTASSRPDPERDPEARGHCAG